MSIKNIVTLLGCFLLVSCANSKLTDSWLDAELKQSYQRPMIIGLSDSQQTRRIFEDHFVAGLGKYNISAIPSHTLISSKQKIERQAVVDALRDSDIDSVIVTYLVSDETETRFRDSPLASTYSGDAESSMISSTLIMSTGRSSSKEVIELKSDLYDRESQAIVFSARTRTVAPGSIDEVISDVTALLIESLFDNGLFK